MIKADIVCLTKTHLREYVTIDLSSYSCFVNNRKELSVRTNKGSGGVAILVKDYLLQSLQVRLVDKSQSGMCISVLLLSSTTRFSMVDTSSFYEHLISQLCLNSYADNVFVAGYFNARIGGRLDLLNTWA